MRVPFRRSKPDPEPSPIVEATDRLRRLAEDLQAASTGLLRAHADNPRRQPPQEGTK